MAYQCKDCSYRGKLSGQGGDSPACGSYNISQGKAEIENKAGSKTRLVILVLLWTYLIASIIWKLVH